MHTCCSSSSNLNVQTIQAIPTLHGRFLSISRSSEKGVALTTDTRSTQRRSAKPVRRTLVILHLFLQHADLGFDSFSVTIDPFQARNMSVEDSRDL